MPSMSSPLYQYQRIKALIVHQLESGEWLPGALIPSEKELAVVFSVSQGTVRKAIDKMVAENLLVRRQGKGTYVATHRDEECARFRFLRLVSDEGSSEVPEHRLLSVRRARASVELAGRLLLDSGDSIVVVKRLLLFNRRPTILEELKLPASMFSGLTHKRLDSYPGSMYALFESEFGVPPVRADEHIRAVLADEESARLLRVEQGEPLLSVERLTYTYGNKPMEWRRGVYVTSGFYYKNELS